MSQFFASGGRRIGDSASASIFPQNTQDWFPLGLTSLISLQSKGLSRVFSNITVQKHQFFGIQPSLCSNSYPYRTIGKTTALTWQTFIGLGNPHYSPRGCLPAWSTFSLRGAGYWFDYSDLVLSGRPQHYSPPLHQLSPFDVLLLQNVRFSINVCSRLSIWLALYLWICLLTKMYL